jgi:TFIIF-interacting CTD phosphatase-like protein
VCIRRRLEHGGDGFSVLEKNFGIIQTMQSAEKKLLILDLDETLIYSTEMKLKRSQDFVVGQYLVYKRPFLHEFIEFCIENFNVAVWTSSTSSYAVEIVANIFQNPSDLKFIWSKTRCTISFDLDLQETFLEKKMTKVRGRGYDLKKVIVVDDLPQVWRNSYGNLVRVKSFFGEADDNELQKLIAYLEKLKDVENIRKIEKRTWQNRI